MKNYFQDLVDRYGIDNIEIIVPMRESYEHEFVNVPCRIIETRYLVSEGYKITLESKVEGFGIDHFYQSDLESMVREGKAIVRPILMD